MKNREIYERVEVLIKKFKSREPDLLIKELGIELIYLKPTKALLGMYRVILRNRFIFIAENVGSLRKTVLAHELGHDQLHRKECMRGISFHESRIFNPINQYEMEANIFAAHLLIPDEAVFNLIGQNVSDREAASRLEVDINLLNLKISEMAKMQILDIERARLESPDGAFLKRYKPMEDDWGAC